jgi:hypothetical protein
MLNFLTIQKWQLEFSRSFISRYKVKMRFADHDLGIHAKNGRFDGEHGF